MLVTVIGIERNPIGRNPNGVECDVCKRHVNFERAEYRQTVDALRREGWTIGERMDDPAFCPEHGGTYGC